eukprot:TRINITY_DN795_c0_g1_i3.p1 TRINITY_DN795_c0_g1~~TRINITY_DN795_c0_g1_i3.p1  ORF type:complete len:1077 (+),score=409.60 TRINITY_DN795_c0_g1_i3:274-3504(+)
MEGIVSVLSVLESAKDECIEKCQREAREHKEWLEKALSFDAITGFGMVVDHAPLTEDTLDDFQQELEKMEETADVDEDAGSEIFGVNGGFGTSKQTKRPRKVSGKKKVGRKKGAVATPVVDESVSSVGITSSPAIDSSLGEDETAQSNPPIRRSQRLRAKSILSSDVEDGDVGMTDDRETTSTGKALSSRGRSTKGRNRRAKKAEGDSEPQHVPPVRRSARLRASTTVDTVDTVDTEMDIEMHVDQSEPEVEEDRGEDSAVEIQTEMDEEAVKSAPVRRSRRLRQHSFAEASDIPEVAEEVENEKPKRGRKKVVPVGSGTESARMVRRSARLARTQSLDTMSLSEDEMVSSSSSVSSSMSSSEVENEDGSVDDTSSEASTVRESATAPVRRGRKQTRKAAPPKRKKAKHVDIDDGEKNVHETSVPEGKSTEKIGVVDVELMDAAMTKASPAAPASTVGATSATTSSMSDVVASVEIIPFKVIDQDTTQTEMPCEDYMDDSVIVEMQEMEEDKCTRDKDVSLPRSKEEMDIEAGVLADVSQSFVDGDAMEDRLHHGKEMDNLVVFDNGDDGINETVHDRSESEDTDVVNSSIHDGMKDMEEVEEVEEERESKRRKVCSSEIATSRVETLQSLFEFEDQSPAFGVRKSKETDDIILFLETENMIMQEASASQDKPESSATKADQTKNAIVLDDDLFSVGKGLEPKKPSLGCIIQPSAQKESVLEMGDEDWLHSAVEETEKEDVDWFSVQMTPAEVEKKEESRPYAPSLVSSGKEHADHSVDEKSAALSVGIIGEDLESTATSWKNEGTLESETTGIDDHFVVQMVEDDASVMDKKKLHHDAGGCCGEEGQMPQHVEHNEKETSEYLLPPPTAALMSSTSADAAIDSAKDEEKDVVIAVPTKDGKPLTTFIKKRPTEGSEKSAAKKKPKLMIKSLRQAELVRANEKKKEEERAQRRQRVAETLAKLRKEGQTGGNGPYSAKGKSRGAGPATIPSSSAAITSIASSSMEMAESLQSKMAHEESLKKIREKRTRLAEMSAKRMERVLTKQRLSKRPPMSSQHHEIILQCHRSCSYCNGAIR